MILGLDNQRYDVAVKPEPTEHSGRIRIINHRDNPDRRALVQDSVVVVGVEEVVGDVE